MESIKHLPVIEYTLQQGKYLCAKIIMDDGCDVSPETNSCIMGDYRIINEDESEDKEAEEEPNGGKENKMEIIKQIVTELSMVKTLKWTCRAFIRINCWIFKPKQVERLSLPTALKNYVLCKDLMSESVK